jgi:hypothetical protein
LKPHSNIELAATGAFEALGFLCQKIKETLAASLRIIKSAFEKRHEVRPRRMRALKVFSRSRATNMPAGFAITTLVHFFIRRVVR